MWEGLMAFWPTRVTEQGEEVEEVSLKRRATLTIRCEKPKWDRDDELLQ